MIDFGKGEEFVELIWQIKFVSSIFNISLPFSVDTPFTLLPIQDTKTFLQCFNCLLF